MKYFIILLIIWGVIFILKPKSLFQDDFAKRVRELYTKRKYDFLYFGKNVPVECIRKYYKFIEEIIELEELFYEEELIIIIDKKPLNAILKDLKLSKYGKSTTANGIYISKLKTIVISDCSNNLPNIKYFELENGEQLNHKLENERTIITLAHEIGHFIEDVSERKLCNSKQFQRAYELEKDMIFKEDIFSYYREDIDEYIAQTIAYYLILKNQIDEDICLTYKYISKYIKDKEGAYL